LVEKRNAYRFAYENHVWVSYYLEDTEGKTKIISCKLILVTGNGSGLCSVETCGAHQLWREPGH